MSKLNDLDFAAFATMAFALALEFTLHLAGNPSLLALLPTWAPPLVLAVAAFARWRLTAMPVSAIPTEVDFDVTPVLDLDDEEN